MNMKPVHPKNIGIVSYDYDPPIGGLGVLVKTYERAMQRLFPESQYIVISPGSRAEERGSFVGRMRHGKSGGCPLFSLALCVTLGGLVRKHAFDVLNVHAGSGGVFLLFRPPCRLVVTAHHTYAQEADIVFVHEPWKRAWKMFMSVLERRTYLLADAVICVSGDTARALTEHYGIPAQKVTVIENPVSIPDAEALLREPKIANTILFVGRLEPRKGILMLLEAFSFLVKDIPEARLRLIGKNLLGSALHDAVRHYDLERNIDIAGFVQDPGRLREMAGATVVVVPSILEGFGLVAAETMILGTCVVASDAPGLRSVVQDDRSGLTFPVGDAHACADALRRILLDQDLRARLRLAALSEARRRFDIDARTRDVMRILISGIQYES